MPNINGATNRLFLKKSTLQRVTQNFRVNLWIQFNELDCYRIVWIPIQRNRVQRVRYNGQCLQHEHNKDNIIMTAESSVNTYR